MHSSHYANPDDPDGPEQWAFHYNGDPLPGPVLINPRNRPRWDTFRTTAQEILVFLAAKNTGALGPTLRLATTAFRLVGDTIHLLAIDSPERTNNDGCADDASEMAVPLFCFEAFADMVIRYKLTDVLEQNNDEKRLAAFALLATLLR